MRRVLLLSLLFVAGCHPFSCTFPPELPAEAPLEFRSSSSAFPKANVRAYTDEWGVPHIYADSEDDAAYAQGFFHAKDRLWQIVSQRAGIFGRLTELLGEDYLDSDRQARMLVYKIEEQFANLSARDKRLMEAYAAGVNDGAYFAGPSIEMVILGVDFEPYEAIHSLAIVRFFGWDLSSGMYEELARNRIMARLEQGDPRREALLQPTDTLGVPVVRAEDHAGLTGYLPDPVAPQSQVAMPRTAPRHVAKDAPAKGPKRQSPRFVSALTGHLFEKGASNVWGVSGEHTEHGAAVMAHDPHLTHRTPGLFYLCHMEHRDWTLAGGSVPGAPGILLGHGRHVAWGTPVSNVDSQDLVRIAPYEGRDDLYLLDGEPVAYETLTQTYKLGPGDDAPVFEEDWKITVFGPVLPAIFDEYQEQDDIFAFMWPGHEPISKEGRLLTALWDIGMSSTIEEANAGIQNLTSPPITMGTAWDNGDIAYRITGDIPVRKSREPNAFPRDGTSSDAGWKTFLPYEHKPQITNPDRGFFVAANQRIVEADGPNAEVIGTEGTLAYRAKRITERIEELIAAGNASTEDIFQIQQDIESVEAREASPIYGASCPDQVSGVDSGLLDTYCTALRDFDGVFDVDSLGALVYTRTERTVRNLMLTQALGDDVGGQIQGHSFVRSAVWAALLDFGQGGTPALLDDPDTAAYDGLAPLMEDAAKIVIDELVEQLGEDTSAWRWGAVHTYSGKGQLASVPVLGMMFTNETKEQKGCHQCVRAERGDATTGEVRGGAVLRIRGEMTSPPDVRVINDSGQSGHFGHRHNYDLHDRWDKGDPLVLAIDEETARAGAEGKVLFLTRGEGPSQ